MPTETLLATTLRPWSPGRALRRVLGMLDRSRSRRDLSRLDDRLLRDIGLTRDDVRAELDRPLWDVPPHWRG